jgi:Protein of unknown function (DUF5818)
MMKLTLSIATLLLGAGTGFGQTAQTFTGDIMDSNCAKMGSHAAMEKEHGMANAKACTLGCVKGSAKFVLYDSATKMSYELDDQKKPESFAGEKVQVKGTLDTAANTIHVESIRKM